MQPQNIFAYLMMWYKMKLKNIKLKYFKFV